MNGQVIEVPVGKSQVHAITFMVDLLQNGDRYSNAKSQTRFSAPGSILLSIS